MHTRTDKKVVDKYRAPFMLDLCDLICGLEAPGTFACGGNIATNPGLTIQGFGSVHLPLQPGDAELIAKLCQRAPFGRGNKTLVDTTVRNTWQLNPSEVKVNKKFQSQINALVTKAVAAELGLGSAKIKSHLYKLLLYEPGGFFVPHKDTEKEKGMFATLVVTLPSSFEGGELIVTHQGDEKGFPAPTDPSTATSWVAFFADCKHEIKPVTSGYRLALVYNLISLENGSSLSGGSMSYMNDAITQAKCCLQRWKSGPGAGSNKRDRTGYIPYATPVHARRTVRSSAEEPRPGCGVNAARSNQRRRIFDLRLALLEFSRRKDDDNYGTYKLHSLVTLTGERYKFQFTLNPLDIYPPGAFDGLDEDSESFEEAMGNEAPRHSLRYHRAVVTLWPKNKWAEIVCEGEMRDAVEYFRKLKASCSPGSEAWSEVLKLAEIFAKSSTNGDYHNVLADLLEIGDLKLIRMFLTHYCLPWHDNTEGQQLYINLDNCISKFGWNTLEPEIVGVAKRESRIKFWLHFAQKTALVRRVKEALQPALRKFVVKFLGFKRADTEENAVDIVCICNALMPESLPEAFELITTTFKKCKEEKISIAKQIFNLAPGISKHKSFTDFIAHCIGLIEHSSNITKIKLKCSCAECKPLAEFLKHPTQMVFRYRGSDTKRGHLRSDALGIYTWDETAPRKHADVITVTTDKRGDPPALVITKVAKDSEVHLKKAKELKETIALLKSMIQSEPMEK